jgi:hypothetical protein
MKQKIKNKALVLLGSNATHMNEQIRNRAFNQCDAFLDDAIEEVFFSVGWNFGLKKAVNIESSENFQESDIKDCLKVFMISPSKTEWYLDGTTLFTKGEHDIICFYFQKNKLDNLIKEDNPDTIASVPNNFYMLTAFCLASNVSYSLHGDNAFADGLRGQYMRKLKDIKDTSEANFEIEESVKYK